MRAAVKSVTCGFHFVNEWHDKRKNPEKEAWAIRQEGVTFGFIKLY